MPKHVLPPIGRMMPLSVKPPLRQKLQSHQWSAVWVRNYSVSAHVRMLRRLLLLKQLSMPPRLWSSSCVLWLPERLMSRIGSVMLGHGRGTRMQRAMQLGMQQGRHLERHLQRRTG